MNKKIISLFISFVLVLCFCNIAYAVASVSGTSSDISGCASCTLDNQDVDISLSPGSPDYVFENLTVGQDITSWFSNVPTGISAQIKEINDDQIIVSFIGTLPGSGSIVSITGSIPQNDVTLGVSGPPVGEDVEIDPFDLTIIDYSDVTYAFDQSYVITGEVGKPIDPQTITVTITNGGSDAFEFDLGIENQTLPTVNGLTPTVTYLDDGDCLTISVEFTGTPISASNGQIDLVIPKEYTNQYICPITLSGPDLKFGIVDNTPTIIPTPTYEIPYTGVN